MTQRERAEELLRAGHPSKYVIACLAAEFNTTRASARGSVSRARKVIEAEQVKHSDPDEEPAPEFRGLKTRQNHFWNKADDKLAIWGPPTNWETVILEGNDVRAAKRMYSRWKESGPEKTINQVAQKFGWSREFFVYLKDELGWTHDQDPFIRPDLQDKTVEDLHEDLVMMKREQLERKRNREEWKETVNDALNWRKFNETTLDPLLELVARGPKETSHKQRVAPTDTGDLLAILAPFDAHVDGKGANGEGFDELRDRLLYGFEATIKRTSRLVTGEKVAVDLALGSDWWNIDTADVKTTAGTPQDNDLHEDEGLIAGLDLQGELIGMAAELGHVHIRMVRGNHDWRTCVAAWWALQQIYAGQEGFSVEEDYEPFQYRLWGEVLMGWHHGHGRRGTKGINYLKQMISLAREYWSQAKFTYQFVGHLHHAYSEDIGGLTIIQQPSEAHTDRWHRDNMYGNAAKGQAAHVMHKSEGLVGSVFNWSVG